jgi:nickel-type superoxide dismutase maturation protease
MLQIIKITGDSLLPTYRQGDFVLISKIPFWLNSIKAGDVVVFRHPVFGLMIKRVKNVSTDQNSYFVIGTHPDSIDSRQFGAISRHDLLGKVIWHFPRPR